MKIIRCLLIFSALFALAALPGWADPTPEPPSPHPFDDPRINFQGRIEEGDIGYTGNATFRFSIFDADEDGVKYWGPTEAPTNVVEGIYNVILGEDTDALPKDVFRQDGPYFLQVEFATEGGAFETLTPRQEILTVPFAVNADLLDGWEAPGSEIVGVDDEQTLTSKTLTDAFLTRPVIDSSYFVITPGAPPAEGAVPGYLAFDDVLQYYDGEDWVPVGVSPEDSPWYRDGNIIRPRVSGSFVQLTGASRFWFSRTAQGSPARPLIAFNPEDEGTGIYSAGDHQIDFSTQSARRLSIRRGGQLRFTPMEDDPDLGDEGDIYFSSQTGSFMYHDGSSWKPIASGTGAIMAPGAADVTLRGQDATTWVATTGLMISEEGEVTVGKKLHFWGDTNTYIHGPAQDTLEFFTGGQLALTLDPSQRIMTGRYGTRARPAIAFGTQTHFGIHPDSTYNHISFVANQTDMFSIRGQGHVRFRPLGADDIPSAGVSRDGDLYFNAQTGSFMYFYNNHWRPIASGEGSIPKPDNQYDTLYAMDDDTWAPNRELRIYPDNKIATWNDLQVGSTTTTSPKIYFGTASTTYITSPASGTIDFHTAGSHRARLSSTGRLHMIPGGTITDPLITLRNDPTTGLWSTAAGTIGLSTGGTEAMRIRSNQHVGIGTGASTSARLHVSESEEDQRAFQVDQEAERSAVWINQYDTTGVGPPSATAGGALHAYMAHADATGSAITAYSARNNAIAPLVWFRGATDFNNQVLLRLEPRLTASSAPPLHMVPQVSIHGDFSNLTGAMFVSSTGVLYYNNGTEWLALPGEAGEGDITGEGEEGWVAYWTDEKEIGGEEHFTYADSRLTAPHGTFTALTAGFFEGGVYTGDEATFTSLTGGQVASSGLTDGRVTYAGPGGILIDDDSFTFDGTVLSATGGRFTHLTGVTSLTAGNLTDGSVVFAGAGGVLSQDNNNLYWNNTLNRLGIGTATPSQALDVDGQIRIRGGVPGEGKILTSDEEGLATWEDPATGFATGTGIEGHVTYWTSETDIDAAALFAYDDENDRVGIGTTEPLSRLHIAQLDTPYDGLADPANYHLVLRTNWPDSTIPNAGPGIAFMSDHTDNKNISAAIVAKQFLGAGRSSLEFYTKSTFGHGDPPELRMTLDTAGRLGLGGEFSSHTMPYGLALLDRTDHSHRTIGVASSTTEANRRLTLRAGGIAVGSENYHGGELHLAGGAAVGDGRSRIRLQAAGGGDAGTDPSPATDRVLIDGTGYVRIWDDVGIGRIPRGLLDIESDHGGAPFTDTFFVSQTGRVGIGHVYPHTAFGIRHPDDTTDTALSIFKTSAVADSTTGLRFRVSSRAASEENYGGAIYFQRTDGGGVGSLHLATKSGGDGETVDIDDARLTITSAGDVGIGTTEPAEQFHTTGSVRFAGAGTPGLGKVLTSDEDGTATWEDAPGGTISGGGTENRVPLWSTSTVLTDSILQQANTTVTVGGDLVSTGITDSTLDPTHVVYAGAGGLLSGDAALTFDGEVLTGTGGQFSALTATTLAVTDGPSVAGQVLTAVDATGLAEWADTVSDITGSGSATTIVRWAGEKELEDSIITDDGDTVTVGGSLAADDITLDVGETIDGFSAADDLGGEEAADDKVPTQLAVKTYVDTATADFASATGTEGQVAYWSSDEIAGDDNLLFDGTVLTGTAAEFTTLTGETVAATHAWLEQTDAPEDTADYLYNVDGSIHWDDESLTRWTTREVISTSGNTFTVDDNPANQAAFRPGTPVRYGGGSWDYGMVVNYAGGVVTVDGAPVNGSEDLQFGKPELLRQVNLVVPGNLIEGTDVAQLSTWNMTDSFIVRATAQVKNAAGGQDAHISIGVDGTGNSLLDSPTFLDLNQSDAEVNSGANINTANYEVAFGQRIFVNVDQAGDQGTPGSHLLVTLQVVTP